LVSNLCIIGVTTEPKTYTKMDMKSTGIMLSPLDRSLAERSGLTPAQVDVIVLHRKVMDGQVNVRKAATQRESRPVTVGAYHRVLSQGRSNVRKAIYTLLLCERVGAVRGSDLIRLLDMIEKGGVEMSGSESAELISVVDRLITLLVTV